jgi:hypothetical protein
MLKKSPVYIEKSSYIYPLFNFANLPEFERIMQLEEYGHK